MTFLLVDNLRSNDKDRDPSLFPSISYKPGQITFLAYVPLEYDLNSLSSYSTIKVHPIHSKDSSIFENMFELGKRNNFVVVSVNNDFSSVLLYVSSVSNLVFNGNIEVILKNTVIDDNAGEYRLTFPGKNWVDVRPLTDKMNTAFAYIIKDYIEFLKTDEKSGKCNFKIIKERVSIPNFPKNLVKVESIARPIVTPAAAGSSRPVVSSPEKKSFFSKLFS